MKNKYLSWFMMPSLLLASCASSKKDCSIFIYNEEDTFISSLCNSMKKMLDEKGYTYDVDFASNSQIQQNEALIDVIDNEKAKLLFVNPVDRLSAGAIIDKVSNKDIPVIFFNRQPLDVDLERGRQTNKKLFYVGTNSQSEGMSQAKMIMDLFGAPHELNKAFDKNGDGKIQMVLLKGEIGHQDSDSRSEGLLEELKNGGYQVDVLSSSYCNWQRSDARIRMKEITEKYFDDIEVVVSNNDDMALGAIDYLIEEKNCLSEDGKLPFPFFGVDGTTVGLDYVRKGYLTGTVKNEGVSQAEACIRIMEDLNSFGRLSDDFPYAMKNEYTIFVEGEPITIDTIDKR